MPRFTLNGRRYDTDEMDDLGISTRECHGVAVEGVFLTRRSRRVFVQTYSIWASPRRDGSIVGRRWHEADADEIGQLADAHDCDELRDLLPAGDVVEAHA